jgi:hypothetical protein
MRAVATALVVLLSVPVMLRAIPTSATEEPPPFTLGDFAIGRKLIAEESTPLQFVFLDFDVYRRSVEPRLEDLRVFDALGEPVPYAIRRRLPEEASISPSLPVPIFRLDPSADRSSGPSGFEGGDYRIDAELSPSGAVVSIHRDGQPSSKRPPRTPSQATEAIGWLLDTSAFERSVSRLDLDLSDAADDFVRRLRLERSDDLSQWRIVDAKIAVARLEHEGHRIERTSFEIPETRARYLRLTPIDGPLPFELAAVRATLTPGKSQPRRVEVRLEGRADPENPDVIHFDLEGLPPIETVQVLLLGMNTIVEGTLESADRPEGPWRVRERGVFYLFDREGVLCNPRVTWKGSGDRYLRFVVSSRGGGLRNRTPQLEIAWEPEQLLYLDRAGGESTLAVGRAGAVDGSFAARDLLRMSGLSSRDLTRATAHLGPEFTLAGDSVLEVATPLPWRTMGLWALLLMIVGIVLGLSFRLMRSAPE